MRAESKWCTRARKPLPIPPGTTTGTTRPRLGVLGHPLLATTFGALASAAHLGGRRGHPWAWSGTAPSKSAPPPPMPHDRAHKPTTWHDKTTASWLDGGWGCFVVSFFLWEPRSRTLNLKQPALLWSRECGAAVGLRDESVISGSHSLVLATRLLLSRARQILLLSTSGEGVILSRLRALFSPALAGFSLRGFDRSLLFFFSWGVPLGGGLFPPPPAACSARPAGTAGVALKLLPSSLASG